MKVHLWIPALLLVSMPFRTQAMDWGEKQILNRQVPPPVVSHNDTFVEVNYGVFGLEFTLSDSNGEITNSWTAEPTDDYSHEVKVIISLGGGYFEVFGLRQQDRQNNYNRPYLYMFHIDDTGYVEDRFRDIDLDRRAKLLDARMIPGGDYIVVYRLGDDFSPTYAARITSQGERLWVTEVLPRGIPFQWEQSGMYPFFKRIVPNFNDPDLVYLCAQINYQYWVRPYEDSVVVKSVLLEMDTAGNILWQKTHILAQDTKLFEGHIFEDGSLALIGTVFGHIQYLHLSEDGDSLETFYYPCDNDKTWSTVYGGDRLMIFSEYATGMGLLYINEDGDSLDGHHFDLDTVGTNFGPILVRPEGKVMCWSNTNFREGRLVDVLISFYPDGLPDEVPPDPQLEPHALSLELYPNPFNSSTTISFTTGSAASPTRIDVYGIDGKRVAELTDRNVRPPGAGLHKVVWNAEGFPAGSYLIKLEAGNVVQEKWVRLVR